MYRVVIVEDSDWIRKGLVFTVPWQDHGFTVVGSAANGLEGLELIRELEPDLVLLDIRMPGLDGLGMMEALKAGGGKVPEFIVLSGYDDFAYTRKAIVLGARDYLLKPLADDELAEALGRVAAALSGSDSAARLDALMRAQAFDPGFVAFFRRLTDESVRRDDSVGYAVRRIEERFDTDLALADIAAELRVSESTLAKRFRRLTGASFVEYATMVRIRKALEFLAEPDCRVSEVAPRVGIADSRYFSQLFKRYTGLTPSQFRKIVDGEEGEGPSQPS